MNELTHIKRCYWCGELFYTENPLPIEEVLVFCSWDCVGEKYGVDLNEDE